MNKKGFTLVEIIGVLAILAISLLAIIPSVINLLKYNDSVEYENFKDDLYLATETYIYENPDLYPDLKTPGKTVKIKISKLREKELVKEDLVNPRTNEVVGDDEEINVYVLDDYEYSYSFGPGWY